MKFGKQQQRFSGALMIKALAFISLGGALFGSGFWLGLTSLHGDGIARISPKLAISGPSNNPMFTSQLAQSGIPSNASSDLREFLQNREALAAKMTELRQQNPSESIDAKSLAEYRQEENAALIQRQKELADSLSKQQAKSLIPMPSSLKMPQGASPQMQSFLTDRDQLMRDQIAFMNQHRNDDPATRQAAMWVWHQQNAAKYQELQQEAQALAQVQTKMTTAN